MPYNWQHKYFFIRKYSSIFMSLLFILHPEYFTEMFAFEFNATNDISAFAMQKLIFKQ